MKPIITPKYDIVFNLTDDCPIDILNMIEPWCSSMYIPNDEVIKAYIEKEQELTDYDLTEKLHLNNSVWCEPDIEIRFNPKSMSQDSWNILQQLPKIIQDSGKVGKFQLDIFEIEINKIKTYEQELVKCNIN